MRNQSSGTANNINTYDYSYLSSLSGMQAKAVGTLLGCMCGDTMGSGVEGKERMFNCQQIFDEDKFSTRGYTDDTEMTYGLAKSLLRKGYSDAQDTCAAYAEEFHPHRGYSRNTSNLFKKIINGELNYQNSGTDQFPNGSFANGGAMRISPLAIAYRNAAPQKLLEGVKNALYCTHRHPSGVDGAYAQALAVQFLLNQQTVQEGSLVPMQLVEYVAKNVDTEEMKTKLELVLRALKQLQESNMLDMQDAYNWEGENNDPQWNFDEQVLDNISEPFQIKAIDATATTLYAYSRHHKHAENAIKGVICYGGDTDTIGAMVGVLAGAMHGCSWIPQNWWNKLEVEMRDQLINVALGLVEMNVQ